ncbi:MAG TPA: lmo0937 family membrane protein [Thermoanaerobaculia bacterium]|nr:lmo0937 family membrane protein [Thermoanaerobaculia bacterium]
MIWTVFVVLLALWLIGYFAFHIGGGLIHLLLLAAVVALVLGIVRRSPPAQS